MIDFNESFIIPIFLSIFSLLRVIISKSFNSNAINNSVVVIIVKAPKTNGNEIIKGISAKDTTDKVINAKITPIRAKIFIIILPMLTISNTLFNKINKNYIKI